MWWWRDCRGCIGGVIANQYGSQDSQTMYMCRHTNTLGRHRQLRTWIKIKLAMVNKVIHLPTSHSLDPGICDSLNMALSYNFARTMGCGTWWLAADHPCKQKDLEPLYSCPICICEIGSPTWATIHSCWANQRVKKERLGPWILKMRVIALSIELAYECKTPAHTSLQSASLR